MSKHISKVSLPEREGNYEIILYQNSQFLMNDGNILYFEYIIDENITTKKLTKHKLYIIKYEDGLTYIPDDSQYICSYQDNAHIRYFVYEDVSENPIIKFSKLFNFK